MKVSYVSEFNPNWSGTCDLHGLIVKHSSDQYFRVRNQEQKDLLDAYALMMGCRIHVLVRKQKAPHGVYGVVRVTFLD